MGSSEWDQLYLDCACNDNFDKVLKIKENDDLISDARSQMVDLAVRNRAFLERASRPTKREMKLFELGQCREARASVVVDGVIHQGGSKSHSNSIQTPILLDSGALGSSYVSKSWVDANRNAVRDSHAIADTVITVVQSPLCQEYAVSYRRNSGQEI